MSSVAVVGRLCSQRPKFRSNHVEDLSMFHRQPPLVAYSYTFLPGEGKGFRRVDTTDQEGRYEISEPALDVKLPPIRIHTPGVDILLENMTEVDVLMEDIAWMEQKCSQGGGFYIAFRVPRRTQRAIEVNLEGGKVAKLRGAQRFWVTGSYVPRGYLADLQPLEWMPVTFNFHGLGRVLNLLLSSLPAAADGIMLGKATVAKQDVSNTAYFLANQLHRALRSSEEVGSGDSTFRLVNQHTSLIIRSPLSLEVPLVLVWHVLRCTSEYYRQGISGNLNAVPPPPPPSLDSWPAILLDRTRLLRVINGASGSGHGQPPPNHRFTSRARHRV